MNLSIVYVGLKFVNTNLNTNVAKTNILCLSESLYLRFLVILAQGYLIYVEY